MLYIARPIQTAMLQNRVDPWGNMIRTSARGAWMGNRGLLHDHHQNLLRPFRLKAWITCLLEFKGRKRSVMAPDRYTELFFFDEATAFAAGHRPCFECRRQDYNKFKTFWLKGNPEYNFDERTSIREIDAILHKERIDPNGAKVLHEEAAPTLPNGTFIVYNNTPYIVVDKMIYPWSPAGYGEAKALPGLEKITVLTPNSIVNTFRAGYIPQISLSIQP
jgi:hypothetical protein